MGSQQRLRSTVHQQLTQGGAGHGSSLTSGSLSPNIVPCHLLPRLHWPQGNSVRKVNILLPKLDVLNKKPILVYSSLEFLKCHGRHWSSYIGIHSSTKLCAGLLRVRSCSRCYRHSCEQAQDPCSHAVQVPVGEADRETNRHSGVVLRAVSKTESGAGNDLEQWMSGLGRLLHSGHANVRNDKKESCKPRMEAGNKSPSKGFKASARLEQVESAQGTEKPG